MAKRKLLELPEGIQNKYQRALGLSDDDIRFQLWEVATDCLPAFPNWDEIEALVEQKIDEKAKSEIEDLFRLEFQRRMVNFLMVSVHDFPASPEITQTELSRKFEKISGLAAKLEEEINQLAEIGSGLVFRPKTTGWRISVDREEFDLSPFIVRQKLPTDEDFFDYIGFRKNLDYYKRIGEIHSMFHTYIGRRSQFAHGYNWYETFIRRVFFALFPTGFDLSITIPTDTNIDYESKLIVLLNILLEHFRIHSKKHECWSDLDVEFSYRQHARLLLKLRKEFESFPSEESLFWLYKYAKE
ncbi:hypothetical protein GCM10008927_06450 [Amylibacter ulvae]|uniref:Uncharacterized protein n=1 Tax=Paramylibacter ulvae TaxID=1651968 RepID=A0ABQ3CV59_9RHOB|nr:hypothetical protein [Amylibacter ulvae]GHA44361.1 hypothetical protein GCM10008927_06450 [Amylibacter ulvae]